MSAIAKLKQQRMVEAATVRLNADSSFHGSSGDISPFRGSGFEGAERRHRETINWNPSIGSPDQQINIIKPMADARARDMSQNDGYAAGGIAIHKDSIVGATYRLNAKPDWKLLQALGFKGATEAWAEQFQEIIERRFAAIGDSDSCWLDWTRVNTFTAQVRLAVGMFVQTGEILAVSGYRREKQFRRYPIKTKLRMISPDRLSNKDNLTDFPYLRRGVEYDPVSGEMIAVWIRKAMPTEVNDPNSYEWERCPMETRYGRKLVLFAKEQRLPDQSRGISEIVAALKQMRMTKQFQEITLQNAVINASYAASIESELPPDAVLSMMGGMSPGTKVGSASWIDQIGAYMTAMNAYLAGSNNIKIDGAMVPHLFPGTKLAMKPMGTPGGVGTGFEQSLLRYISAAFGLSYEELSHDFSQTNYSSAQAAAANTGKGMASKKKMAADRYANWGYTLTVEEEVSNRTVPLPPGMTWDNVFGPNAIPLAKEALCKADWIGASKGQIDQLKETQAAMLRIKGGLSTYEIEASKLGSDFRDLFDQIAREQGIIKAKGIIVSTDESQKSLMSDNTGSQIDGNVKSGSPSTQDAKNGN